MHIESSNNSMWLISYNDYSETNGKIVPIPISIQLSHAIFVNSTPAQCGSGPKWIKFFLLGKPKKIGKILNRDRVIMSTSVADLIFESICVPFPVSSLQHEHDNIVQSNRDQVES